MGEKSRNKTRYRTENRLNHWCGHVSTKCPTMIQTTVRRVLHTCYGILHGQFRIVECFMVGPSMAHTWGRAMAYTAVCHGSYNIVGLHRGKQYPPWHHATTRATSRRAPSCAMGHDALCLRPLIPVLYSNGAFIRLYMLRFRRRNDTQNPRACFNLDGDII